MWTLVLEYPLWFSDPVIDPETGRPLVVIVTDAWQTIKVACVVVSGAIAVLDEVPIVTAAVVCVVESPNVIPFRNVGTPRNVGELVRTGRPD